MLITRTSSGRRLRAASQAGRAAAVLGVRVAGLRTATYALAAASSAVAGAPLGMCFSFTPTSGTDYLLTGMAVVVIGGLSSIKGTVLGGLLLGLVEAWGAHLYGDGYRLFVGLLAFLVLLVLVAVLAASAALPFVTGPYYQQIGYQFFQLVALATARNLLAGYTGLVSLGSGAFVGLGLYASALLSDAQGWPLLLPAAGAVAVAFAVLVSPALFRLRGLYVTVANLALAEALRILAVNSRTFKGASGIFLDASAPDFYVLYWIVLAIAGLSAPLVAVVPRPPVSLSLRGIRDDEDVASEMGVSAFRTKLWAFALSAFVMGVVGALQAFRLGGVGAARR